MAVAQCRDEILGGIGGVFRGDGIPEYWFWWLRIFRSGVCDLCSFMRIIQQSTCVESLFIRPIQKISKVFKYGYYN